MPGRSDSQTQDDQTENGCDSSIVGQHTEHVWNAVRLHPPDPDDLGMLGECCVVHK